MEIKFDKKNYRRHSDENKAMIRKSLDECGIGRSILVDSEDEIIAGNGVYEQAKAKGVPVRVVETDGTELVVVKRTDLKTDDERRRKLALADNAASDNVEWDKETLLADFDAEELQDWGVELDNEINQDGDAADIEDKAVDPFGRCFVLLEYHPNHHARVMENLKGLMEDEAITINTQKGGHLNEDRQQQF